MHTPLAPLLDAIPHPALLAWPDAAVLHANPSAAAMLRQRSGLQLNGGRLAAPTTAETCRLRRGLAASRPIALVVGRGAARPLAVSLAPAGNGAVLVQAIDPDAVVLPTPQALAVLFGLTRAEARIALAVGAGRSLPQAAVEQGIAASTARTHLNQALAKTGAARQAELAALLARVATWAPPADPAPDLAPTCCAA
jgi:DNA-binding CsgD family transcriptional regulator